jgi:prephenate dehydrogenase
VSRPFDTIAIVGVGLMGGSLAAAVKALDDAPHVIGIEPDREARAWALSQGIVDAVLEPIDAEQAFRKADLVVLASPSTAVGEWLGRIGELDDFEGVVTDVASVKTGVYLAAMTFLGERAVFIGGHPMAGSERSGVQASSAEMFKGAYYVLSPSDTTPPEAYQRLDALITSIGARVISIPPEAHDEAVAAISHVPHIAASALTNLAAERADSGHDVLRLAAGGFKDMTRIAAGSPELWTGICLDNRDSIARGLAEYAAQLEQFRGLLASGSAEAIREWLARAADVRRALPARWVPASAKLEVLSVPMADRPGMVSAVTQAAARAGCNIEDIEIDHTSEDTAVLRLILTDEGDHVRLMSALRADGFDPDLRPLSEES